MRLLLDTHALIWHYEANADLSEEARKLIDAPDNQLFISIASLWEMVIKVSLGKLTLRKDVQTMGLIYLTCIYFRKNHLIDMFHYK